MEDQNQQNQQYWNGSSWTEINDLSTARLDGGSAGSINSSFIAGGSLNNGTGTPFTTATEEFSTSGATAVQEGQLWIKTTT